MADTKVTALAAITPVLTDVMYIVDDPGGVPSSNKVTLTAINTLLAASTKTLTNTSIDQDGTGNSITNIANASIKAAAAIALNKLAATTASRALVSDGSGFVSAATTTATEIGYVNGVTSAIQTQIDGKAASSHNHNASDINAGTLTHERGGLEADVSAYDGIVRITGGATSAMTFADEDDMSSDGATTVASQQSIKAYSDTSQINAQVGTTYTLVIGDRGKTVTMTNASANTLTIPANASVAFPTGTVITVIQGGAGATTISAAATVTLNGVSTGSGAINTQYQGVSLLKTATNTWIASGDIATVA